MVSHQGKMAGTQHAQSHTTLNQPSHSNNLQRRQEPGGKVTSDKKTDFSCTYDFDQQFSFPYLMCIASAYGKPASPLYWQLVSHNNRSMGSASGIGLQVGAGVSSGSEVNNTFGLRDQQDKPSGGGNTEVTRERRNKESK